MGWTEDVEQVVQQLPRAFSLRDVYRFAPRLHALHPENRHLREKIRQQLQVLRDRRILAFEGEGTYVRTDEPEKGRTWQGFDLPQGTLTTRDELANRLGFQSADPLRRGMFKAATGPLSRHLFLFHDERNNPYGDVVEEDRIYYVGQGAEGDQQLSSYNRYLAEHLDRGLTIHYFVQPKELPGKILYKGEVVVEETRRIVRQDEGRSVLCFTLVPVRPGTEDPVSLYGNEFAEVLDYNQPVGPLTVPRRQTLASRVSRDAAFRRVIVWLYETQCAVCGDPLTRETVNELEAAHIMAVSERGPDDPRNGLSLCGRHHWAFDNGFFTVDPKLKLRWLSPSSDPHGEIRDGEGISLPRDPEVNPHLDYLKCHWKKWGVAF